MARELTREEKAAIRRLVISMCANYDRECGCLPLDCEDVYKRQALSSGIPWGCSWPWFASCSCL